MSKQQGNLVGREQSLLALGRAGRRVPRSPERHRRPLKRQNNLLQAAPSNLHLSRHLSPRQNHERNSPKATDHSPIQLLVANLVLVVMKTALRSLFVALISVTMLLSSGCEEKNAATSPSAESTPGSTKPLEA